jgi:hypothetical protein
MSDFEDLIYLTPIFGLIIICFYKCCCYNSSIKNNNNINNQLENINYSERIPIINDRFPVILYTIENNDLGRYFITGNTETLNVFFWENGGIFHGENLYANTVNFYHRGSNDLFIRPINFLNGNIYNVGDVNCYSRPPQENVNVTEHYRGRLIYR